MNYTHVLIRYGELGTKGKTKDFINTLNKMKLVLRILTVLK